MKHSKRILAFLVAMLLAVGMTACSSGSSTSSSASGSGSASDSGSSSSGREPVTLRVFMQDTKSTDDALVAEAISQVQEVKDLGVTVEIVKYGAGEYKEKIPLVLTSDEQMDICFDAGWLAYLERVQTNAYVDITDMLDSTPELKEAIPETLWNGMRVNGRIYGVPTYKELGEQWAFYAEEDFLKEAGIDPASIDNFNKAGVILEALAKTDRAGFQIGNKGIYNSMFMLDNYDSLDGSQNSMVMIKKDDPTVIVNSYETEDYKEGVTLLYEWFQKGYISPDVLTRENYDEYIKNGNYKYGLGYVSYSPQNEIIQSTTYGKTLTPMPVTPITITNSSARGSLFAILSKCENKERALEFLQVWNTVPEVKNLFAYGIEGKHYNLIDGQVERVEDANTLYASQNWTTGNSFISYTLVGETKDKWEQYLAWNEQGVESECLGFTPDTTKVADKLSACNAVIAEYGPMLQTGSVNPEEYLPKFQQALKDAGVDEVIAEYQSQYDAWLAEK